MINIINPYVNYYTKWQSLDTKIHTTLSTFNQITQNFQENYLVDRIYKTLGTSADLESNVPSLPHSLTKCTSCENIPLNKAIT